MFFSGTWPRVSSSRSLSAPRGADEVGEVAQRRTGVAGQRAQLGEEAAQLRRDRLGLADERAQVVDRGAQVDERRVRAAHERRQLADRVGQRVLLAADRAGRVGEVVDEAGEVLALLGEVGHELRRSATMNCSSAGVS